MVNETDLADVIHTAKRRLQIMLDSFDRALVASRTYSQHVEPAFDDAHFLGHEALAAICELEAMATHEAAQA